ncbi:MAG: AMP-binding protein [Rhizobiaceae bacterium]
MGNYFDTMETRDARSREKGIFQQLPEFLSGISNSVPGWTERLSGLNLAKINSRDALAQLPILRKTELMEAQSTKPPFGGFVDETMLDGTRIFMSPGPVWEPQGPGRDPWHAARALFAAGIRKSDLVHTALSYHMTPGGFIMDEGVQALGARIFPGGVGNTEGQVEAAHVLKPVAYCGTPDFLKTMLDKAEEMERDLSSIKVALVSGGALFPSMRDEYEARGVAVMQCYATADLGVIAYETRAEGELCQGMVCSEKMIVEIVRPGTNEPVPAGEVGELVVTNLNRAYPLIRFGTGDLSALLPEPSPCGRTNMRIAGWMGRADQRTKVKGMFIDPKQVDELVKSMPEIEKARLVVARENDRDVMELQIRAAANSQPDIEAIEQKFTAITKLKGSATIVTELPNDGKVIDDQRDYSS